MKHATDQINNSLTLCIIIICCDMISPTPTVFTQVTQSQRKYFKCFRTVTGEILYQNIPLIHL